MKKDIEKRARCYASSQKPFGDKTDLILGYENGAKEQKALDIEGLSKRIYEFFGENGSVEFNGSLWNVDELEETLLYNLRKE